MLQKTKKSIITRKLNIYIPAQNPSSLTSLNAVLGQNAVNVFEFTKQFNQITKDYLNDIILNIEIFIYFDKKFDIILKRPSVSFLINEFFHVSKYEKDINTIVKFKLSDLYKISVFIKTFKKNEISLKSIFKSLLATINSMHIETINDLV